MLLAGRKWLGKSRPIRSIERYILNGLKMAEKNREKSLRVEKKN